MADNYLEKQYEQYLKKKADWEKSSKNKHKTQGKASKDDFYWES